MNTILHRADERGYANHNWLKTYHSFSFASFYDPQRMGFGKLRVFNDDIVAPSMGFGTHPHDNMEIVSIPLRGALEHKDSTGTHGVIHTNDIQLMSAGSGIQHSEKNHSAKEDVNFFQIWVMPNIRNIEPQYQQKTFKPEDRKNQLLTIISPDPNENQLKIHQDAWFSLGTFEQGQRFEYQLKGENSGVYLMLVEGQAKIGGETLERRDAIGIWDTDKVKVKMEKAGEVLVVEVPMN